MCAARVAIATITVTVMTTRAAVVTTVMATGVPVTTTMIAAGVSTATTGASTTTAVSGIHEALSSFKGNEQA
jgi:hypothetical protein